MKNGFNDDSATISDKPVYRKVDGATLRNYQTQMSLRDKYVIFSLFILREKATKKS